MRIRPSVFRSSAALFFMLASAAIPGRSAFAEGKQHWFCRACRSEAQQPVYLVAVPAGAPVVWLPGYLPAPQCLTGYPPMNYAPAGFYYPPPPPQSAYAPGPYNYPYAAYNYGYSTPYARPTGSTGMADRGTGSASAESAPVRGSRASLRSLSAKDQAELIRQLRDMVRRSARGDTAGGI